MNNSVNTNKYKRCPKGTRRNKNTGLCEPFGNTQIQIVNKTSVQNETVEPNTKRCKNGTRRNKKTGLCEPIPNFKKKNKKIIIVQNRPENILNFKTDTPIKTLLTKKLPIKITLNNTLQTNKIVSSPKLIPIENKKSLTPVMETAPENAAPPTPEIENAAPPTPEIENAAPPTPEIENAAPPTPEIENAAPPTPEIENAPPPTPSLTNESLKENPIDFTNIEKTLEKAYHNKKPNDYNSFKENIEYEYNKTNNDYSFLYPDINDPNFNIKIAEKKEFNDTQYDGTIYDVKLQSNKMCNAILELQPYQLFVKNFLSLQTPYNSLLLYHGLGTGKTTSAIGISEENRHYMKQIGLNTKIIIIASPNVQSNFRMQLFNEQNLKYKNGLWNINSILGNSLLEEINQSQYQENEKDKLIKNINTIINKYYEFTGYIEFANSASKIINAMPNISLNEKQKNKIRIKNIKRYYNNRLIIVDEVHNIRLVDDNKIKNTAKYLFDIAEHAEGLRFLLLSATPMYNSYKEIVWLTNLLNLNDKRSQIKITDVFDANGNFQKNGKDLLTRKLTGYVSYVRSENPYTFPYRIYKTNSDISYIPPTIQINKTKIKQSIQHIPLYYTLLGDVQENGYKHITNLLLSTKKTGVNENEQTEYYGYQDLQQPIQLLNMMYPSIDFNIETMSSITKEQMVKCIGKTGLDEIMNYIDNSTNAKQPEKFNYKYKPDILEKYGRIFNKEHIHKYSGKISKICDIIRASSKGIIMIYSQYIEGGILPVSLALEEMGFTRFSSASYSKSFFETPPTEPIDALSLQPKSSLPKGQQFYPAKYVIISGDETFSPNNAEDIKHITNSNNKYGEKIKVVIISKAGAEGLDFKNIRQIHILEPWYNINRIEQIIGRGVRNKSHCLLPFEERNVEIFIYSSLMKSTPTEECADTYVYRFAEKKSIQIGKITRLLKETSVDCLLNIGQTNFSVEKIMSVLENTKIKQQLTSENGKEIDYQIGDKPFSSMCDYMDNCVYGCVANKETLEIKSDTYNIGYINNNQSIITKKIKDLFQERVAYSHKELIQILNHQKIYPIEQIYNSLTKLIENKEYITDKYERYGTIINKDDIYAFQPIEITDENISIYERSVPIEYKRKKVLLKVPENFYEVNEIKDPLNSVIDEPGVIQNNTPNVNYNPTIKNLWKNIETNYRVIISTDEETREYKKLSQKHKTFFINARLIMEYIEVIFQIPHKKIIQYLIFKMIDISSFKEKMGFAKELFLANPPPNPLFMEFPFLKDTIVTYFKNKMFNDKIMYITDDNYNFVLYRWSQKMEEWEEIHDKTPYISNIQKMIIIVPKIDTMVGFYKNSIFKMIDNILAKRNKGFDILQAQKQKIIQMYNYFIEKYNSLQTNIQLRKYTDKENIYKDELCVIVEILIRYIRETYGEKVFLTEDEASLIRLGEL